MSEESEPVAQYSSAGLRRYARRRGYRLHKIRKADRYALIDVETGDTTVAREHGETLAECYFTGVELREYLSGEPIRRPQ